MNDLSDFGRPLVVVSNRGPLSFEIDENDELKPQRAGGGLVSSLAPVLKDTDALWICTAVSEGDRRAAQGGTIEAKGFRLHQIEIERGHYGRYYDVISNGMLWFLHHNLFDLEHRPKIDDKWWDAWNSYVRVNQVFADTVAAEAPHGATVLVHDYHLTLLGRALKESRPDLKTVHFHHTPFVDANSVQMLPPDALRTLLAGLAGHDACGFHSERWAENFRAVCAERLGEIPNTFVSAAAPDIADITKVAQGNRCQEARKPLALHRASGRKLLVRVDRIELSKNIVRGFLAYDDLLKRYPQWLGKVTFAAFSYPSRVNLPDYVAYRKQIDTVVADINERWGTKGWQPIELRTHDDFPTSVAAYLEYDVLLVNPLRDGLNLVAKEGVVLNENDGVLVLSREAGSWNELKRAAIGINPYDVSGTADALFSALEMDPEDRKSRAERLRAATLSRTANDWLGDQLRAAD